ncbi:sensor histidine kinase [Wenxinia marina]|uniref:histidine kinase n=1 Tax=Wenxinia marina DSM 24838 TaxID=1123501 RepID=A0A0D0NKZ3_9RHOB|nr:HAMP domain-containing sensor histidine kinase [Wenxinia marina]KIQ68980.1 His Kinase A (phospho-acceptor) domain protein/Histidine kinase-, DNA gyrase B [Wenxinia marina DSM 24838]GGL63603.1 hypothetical protein GCM10011392_17920 [Wenxinia marina]
MSHAPQPRASEGLPGGPPPNVTAGSDLDDFVYRISHDLRSSVRALHHLPTWILEDLQADGVELPDSPRRSLSHIASHARRIDHMLNGLLDYARVGRLQSVVEQSPRDALDEVIDALGPPPGVTIVNELSSGRLSLGEADLMRIFNILVGNAIRHAPNRPLTIRVDGAVNDGAWKIAVSDDGPGIPDAYREAVFQPMVKLVSRDQDEGAGMGLAVLAKIAVRCGGRAWIETADGGGARVCVRLGPD